MDTSNGAQPSDKPARWVVAIVALNGLVFVDFGLAFLAKPSALAGLLDIQLQSASALADLRAMYGGLSLAVGVMMALSLRRRARLQTGLVLVVLTSGGLAVGRAVSALVSGLPSGFIVGMFAVELASAIWAALAYRALDGSSATNMRRAVVAA